MGAEERLGLSIELETPAENNSMETYRISFPNLQGSGHTCSFSIRITPNLQLVHIDVPPSCSVDRQGAADLADRVAKGELSIAKFVCEMRKAFSAGITC